MWNTRSAHSYRTIDVLLALLVASVPLAYSGSDPPPPPEPIDSENAALGIYLKMRAPMKRIKVKPDLIFFARLEEDEGIDDLDLETDLIPSTWVDGYHVYLLNVPPGTYVAVAEIRWRENPPSTIRVASWSVGPFTFEYYLAFVNNPDAYRSYFSRQLIEETKTTVGPRSFSFMGEFVADATTKVKKADEIQRHFMGMIEGKRAHKSKWTKIFLHGEYTYLLALHEADRSKSAEIQFFTKAKNDLAGSPWAVLIDERLEGQ